MKQRLLDLLQETIDYYSEDVSRRAVEGGDCVYCTKDGRMCAVGRCLVKPQGKTEALMNSPAMESTVGVLLSEYSQSILKKGYRGIPVKFWGDLQRLHDNNMSWVESGLSVRGRERVSVIKESINNGHYE